MASNKNSDSLLSPSETSELYGAYENVVCKLKEFHDKTFGTGVMSGETEWAERVLTYNVANYHKHMSGSIVPAAFKSLSNELANRDETKLGYAYLLGWVVETVNSSFNIVDNMMNQAQFQMTCKCHPSLFQNAWYREPKVGLSAINDSFMLQMMTYNMSNLFLSGNHTNLRYALNDAARETNRQRISGTAFEESLKKEENVRCAYTLDNYRQVVKYKFAYPVFVAPVRYALILADMNEDVKLMQKISKIMVDIGYLAKLRLELGGIFNENEVFRTSKMTWFFVRALEMLTAQNDFHQISALDEAVQNEDIQLVRKCYKRLGLVSQYERVEETLLEDIQEQAQALKDFIDPKFFMRVLDNS